WQAVREQRAEFFIADGPAALWRISVPSAAPALELPGPTLVEWGGALRWLRADAGDEAVRNAAAAHGGHATLFRGRLPGVHVFHAPSPALMRLHRNLKREFDPHGIFNPGRMFAGL
ncbi:MAG: glycolate oxidase subunit GlcE, partial [Burkholderiales bacterium]